MRQDTPPRAPSGDSGNLIVELALALPLLLLMVAGMLDIGKLVWEKQVLTTAAREGARAGSRAVLNGAPEFNQSQVKNVVYRYIYKFNLKKEDGNPLVTEVVKDVSYTLNAGTCIYTFPSSGPSTTLSVELTGIPVKMILLPNIQKLSGYGELGSVLILGAKASMYTEWVTPPAN